jgi:hypothetical protein
MIQPRLFPDDADNDRWAPVEPPYRPPRSTGTRPRKPLVGQKRLPGMDWDEAAPGAEAESRAAGTLDVHGPAIAATVTHGGAICPNCGGTVFDADGDCVGCWEPGVPRPSAG